MTHRPYVEIPRPYEYSPGRFDVELTFPASSRQRAEQHQSIAWELARIHDVEAQTPYKLNPRWSVYEEQWGNGERHGSLDHRRLKVHGKPRSLARYLASLRRVLTALERLATRAARAFGSWRRSLLAQLSGHLEYEDPTTLRIRAKDFRSTTLTALTGFLAQGAADAGHRDPSRPLWEQAGAVAAEVWAEAGGVNAWEVADHEVQAELQRMLRVDLSVVEDPQTTSTPRVPDTVDELLELSGPADQAPVEQITVPHPTIARTAAPVEAPVGRDTAASPPSSIRNARRLQPFPPRASGWYGHPATSPSRPVDGALQRPAAAPPCDRSPAQPAAV
ncbi:hypothetical protein ACWD0A_27585 [Streptomyces sp. NPDC002867]